WALVDRDRCVRNAQSVRTACWRGVRGRSTGGCRRYCRAVTPSPPDLPSAPLVVAAIQATPSPGDVSGNAALAARLVEQAATAGAALAVLPELFLPAYHPPTLLADPDGTDLVARGGGRVEDPRLEPLSAVAREHAIAVVVGGAVRHPDGRRTCAAVVVNRNGEVRAAYAKQHLWGSHERALFAPGRAGATLV